MIHYTEALTHLVADIVTRVEALSFIDVSKLMIFARRGRTDASGSYATCHSLNLPTSEPGYYFWRDRETGRVTRRTEWFVTRTPEVWIGQRRLDYLLSFTVPRFCDQALDRSRKAVFYQGFEPWIAKLDTVVHELYHIAPGDPGLRRVERADGVTSSRSHGPTFLEDVSHFVKAYLRTRPDPARVDFLRHDFRQLSQRHGGILATTFRTFPSYPQRYVEAVVPQPEAIDVAIVPLPRCSQPSRYTEGDLQVRLFTERGSQPVPWPSLPTAA